MERNPIDPRSQTEPNPLYWLEKRQAKHGYHSAVCLLFGIAMSFFLGLLILNKGQLSPPFYGLPIFFYSAGLMLIPLTATRKMAHQLLNDDLVLRTPLSGREVLGGKCRLARTLLGHLHLPTVPFLFVLLAQGHSAWIALSCGFAIGAVCLTNIGLGFAAGARTSYLRAVLFFLGGVHFIALICIAFIICGLIFVSLYVPSPVMPNEITGMFAFLAVSFFGLVSSYTILNMGISIFDNKEDMRDIFAGCCFLAGLGSVIFLPVIMLLLDPLSTVILAGILICYIGAPLLGLGTVVRSKKGQRSRNSPPDSTRKKSFSG